MTQVIAYTQSKYTTNLSYLHLYAFYPYVISSRIAVGGGFGIGIPIGGELLCDGYCDLNTAPSNILETDDIGKEINILLNASFAFTQRYAIRAYYQHGLTEVGEYYPAQEDDPGTLIEPDGITGNETRAGFKGFSTRLVGVSLVLRF